MDIVIINLVLVCMVFLAKQIAGLEKKEGKTR